MSKYFPKLSQTHVFIQTDEQGGGFNCHMLPVSALSTMQDFSECLEKSKSIAETDAVRTRMIDLVKTVMPEEYHENLMRLDILKLSELIQYLMYGDSENDDQPKKKEEPAGKN